MNHTSPHERTERRQIFPHSPHFHVEPVLTFDHQHMKSPGGTHFFMTHPPPNLCVCGGAASGSSVMSAEVR